MIRATFEWREDPEHGIEGWIGINAPANFNTSEALGVTHDLMEHFANDFDTLEGELRAFGAMLYIRGEGGYFERQRHQFRTPEFHMAGELSRFIYDCINGDATISEPPVTRPLDDDYPEDILQRILKETNRQANSELAFRDADEEEVDQNEINRLLERIAGWMRFGYRKAVRRYHGQRSDELAYLFESVAAEIKRVGTGGQLGDLLKVGVECRTCSTAKRLISVKRIHAEDRKNFPYY